MALNLGARLRDAVDGPVPGLDGVVGEDPADVDLPALSARIRHRRRVRATTRSAVGVAAAGAVTLVGAQGLGGRGAEARTVPLSHDQAVLCAADVTAMPTLADEVFLVPPGSGLVADASGNVGPNGTTADLGAFVGRTLTAVVVQNPSATTGTAGDIALTRGGTVVAVGTTVRQGPATQVEPVGTGSVTSEISTVSADLTACPTSGGGPARVPAGTYSVQYLVPVVTAAGSGGSGGSGGTLVAERSTAGPWQVTLLDEPPAVTLPAGYPSGEVPVVGGTLLSATPGGSTSGAAASTGWTVSVAVQGDNGVARAAAALRAAGATVTPPEAVVSPAGDVTTSGPWSAAQLDELLVQRAGLVGEVNQARTAYDGLLATHAAPDTMAVAAGELQAALVRLTEAEARLALATGASVGVRTYQVVGPTTLAATTRSWSVELTQTVQDGRTTLTYTLAPRG